MLFSFSELGTGTVVSASDECLKVITDKLTLNEHSEPAKLALAAFLYLWIHVSKSYNIG